jgi:2-oxoglutarate dehydrogenase E2 component (dihydrolipoamide succinyltransferase)
MLIDVTLPQLGESVTEGTIAKWLVREGDVVKKDQPMLEIATDKADSELPAPASGRVARILASEGQVVPVNTVLAQIEEGATAVTSPAATTGVPPAPKSSPDLSSGNGPARSATGGALATPTARKIALENDVDLSTVSGTGSFGRVTKEDVLRARVDSPLLTTPHHTEPPLPAGTGVRLVQAPCV